MLDGFSAPLTTGNFVDLVRTGRYNGARVEAGEKGLYVQLGGKPDNSTKRRTVPMEILVEGDRIPLYGSTLDDLGVADLQPALPVTAYGALAMVHSLEDCNDASDQFLITLINPRSYTARSPGGSALTGNLAAFGFVTDGKHLLPQLRPGDVVKSAKVVSGEENFRASG